MWQDLDKLKTLTQPSPYGRGLRKSVLFSFKRAFLFFSVSIPA